MRRLSVLNVLIPLMFLLVGPGCGGDDDGKSGEGEGAEGEGEGREGEGEGEGEGAEGEGEGEGEGGGPTCSAGQTQDCACPEDAVGQQSCTEAGEWGDCFCPECQTNADCSGRTRCVHHLCYTAERACAAADEAAIAVDASTSLTLDGTRAEAGSNFNSGCMDSGLVAEGVFRLDLAEPLDLVVHVETQGALPTLYLRSACAAGEDLACANFVSGHGRLIASDLPAGSYWLFVDGVDHEAVEDLDYQITVTSLPADPTPGGERCEEAVPLEFPADSRRLDLFADLQGAADDLPAFCGRAEGPETLYTLTLKEPSRLIVDWSSEAAGAGLALLPACAADARPLGCLAGVDARLNIPRLAAGTYYLVAQGEAAAASSAYLLGLGLGAPAVAPTNDRCEGASVIALLSAGGEPAAEPVTVRGDLTTAADDYSTSCGEELAGAGPDAVYRVTVPEGQELVVDLVTDDFSGVVALRPFEQCDSDEPAAADIACQAAGTRLRPRNLPAGEYALIVDSLDSSAGAFSLTVQLRLPSDGDRCDDPLPLVFDPAGLATAAGSTEGRGGDYRGSCGGSAAPDVVYSLHLDEPVKESTFTLVGAGWDTLLYLVRDACDGGTAIACNDDCHEEWCPDSSSSFTVPRLAPGDYFLVVDGFGEDDFGDFSVEVQLGPPPAPPANETCAAAEVVEVPAIGETASVEGDLSMAADDQPEGSCLTADGAGQDIVYQLHVSEASLLRVQAAGEAGTSGLGLQLLGGSCAEPQQLGCLQGQAGDAATLVLPRVEPGDYWLVVDALGPARGIVELTIKAEAPPAPPENDSCASAEPLELSLRMEPVMREGNLLPAGDDLPEASCLAGAVSEGAGHEVVYLLQVTEPLQLVVEETDAHRALGLSFQLFGGACAGEQGAEELGCALGDQDAAAQLISPRLEAGSYWLVVAGQSPSWEGFALRMTTWNPPEEPLNEDCGAAAELDWESGQLVAAGNHSLAGDDLELTCGSPDGADLVYHFTVAERMALRVVATAPAWSGVAVALRGQDCAAGEELLCLTGGESTVLPDLPAGEYYLVIDTPDDTDPGPFQVVLTAAEPVVPGAHDTCLTAGELRFDASGLAQALGTNEGATADLDGVCGGDDGLDTVYHFKLGEARGPSTFLLDARSLGDHDTVLHLSYGDDCAAAVELACNDDNGGASRSMFTLDGLDPGDYYVWADGYDEADFGMFDLSVQLGPIVEPEPNDRCTEALPLPLVAAGTQLTTQALTQAADDAAGSCGGAGGHDLVWRLHLEQEQTIAVHRPSEAGEIAVYLRAVPEGGDCAAGTELACVKLVAFADRKLPLATLPAGDYDLYVDGGAATLRSFHLDVMPVVRPANDTCATAGPVALAADGRGTLEGTLEWAVDDAAGSCSSAGSAIPETVHRFVLEQPTGLALVRPAEAGSLTVYLRRGGCVAGPAASEELCGELSSNTATNLVLGLLPAGEYFLFVEGSSGLPYHLQLQPVVVPANDQCGGAAELTFDDAGRAQAAGTTVNARADYTGNCTAAGGPEVVYHFHLDRPRGASTFTMTGAGAGSFDTVLYLRKGDCAAGLPVGCNDDSGASRSSFQVAALGPGDYYLFADGYGATTAGAFLLEATLGAVQPAPANDVCGDGAIALDAPTAAAPTAIASAELGRAVDDEAGSCGGERSGDLVYRFTLAAPADLALSGGATDGDLSVWLRRENCSEGEELFCGTFPEDQGMTRAVGTLPAGSYFLFVDSDRAASFALQLTVVELPGNDSCVAPAELVWDDVLGGVVIEDDLQLALDDEATSCSASAGASVRDLVYQLTVPADGSYALVRPGGDESLTVSLRSADCLQGEELFCGELPAGEFTVEQLPELTAGDYFLVVESDLAETFELQLLAADAPANDDCAGAVPPSVDEDGLLHLTGNLLFAADDVAADEACGLEEAPEVVFAVTLDEPTSLRLTRAAEAGDLQLRVSGEPCASGEVMECLDIDGGESTVALLPELAAGTWYFVVEGGAEASFDLTLEPVVQPKNESCVEPDALSFDAAGHASASADTTLAADDHAIGCGVSAGGRDVVYTLQLAAVAKVTARTVASWDTKLALYKDPCGAPAGSLVCNDDDASAPTGTRSSRVVKDAVPAGTYFLIVDGYGAGAFGEFELVVDVDPPSAVVVQ